MAIEETLSWFYDNPLVTFIGSVGLLIMTFLAVKETLEWINNGRKKPKLKIIPQFKYGFVEPEKPSHVSFSIIIKNTGKLIASQCTVSAIFTSLYGKPKYKLHNEKVMVLLDWIHGKETMRTIDLLPVEYSEGLIELPLEVSINNKEKSFGIKPTLERNFFNEGYSTEDIFTEDENKNKFYNLRVIFYLTYNSQMIERQFLIKIKTYPFPILEKDITFTSIDAH